MKEIQTVSSGANYSTIALGEFDQLMDHSYIHPDGQRVNREVIWDL
jgi:hypothetical protein